MGNLVGFHAVTWGNISSLKAVLVAMDMMVEVFHGEDISIFFLFLKKQKNDIGTGKRLLEPV